MKRNYIYSHLDSEMVDVCKEYYNNLSFCSGCEISKGCRCWLVGRDAIQGGTRCESPPVVIWELYALPLKKIKGIIIKILIT